MTEQLKVLALAAAVIDHNENRGWYEEDMLLQDGVYYTKNARFIAAASPDVVLALIAERDNLKDTTDNLDEMYNSLSRDYAELKAELAALESQEPCAWAIQGSSFVYKGEHAKVDAKAEAKRVGGTCRAYPLYTAAGAKESK